MRIAGSVVKQFPNTALTDNRSVRLLYSDELRKELVAWVRKEIGPIATPDFLQWAPSLPKTRSGKIMRRILRKIGENLPDQLGDISTLADPSVVKNLVDERLIK